MSITVASGFSSSKVKAAASVVKYDDGNRLYGRLLDSYRSNAPKGLAIAHLVSVNPSLVETPLVTKDRRRGFMKATITMAREAGIDWEDLDDMLTCAYVWGRDINSDSLSLYTNNQTLFSFPSRDFWSTSYLKHRLGSPVFDYLWTLRDTTRDTVFESLLYTVNNLKRNVLGVPVIQIKQTALVDCQFVIELAKKAGTLSSTGFGLQPVLNESAMKQVF